MKYHEDIKNILKSYVQNLESIGNKDSLPRKVIKHLDKTVEVVERIDGKQPNDYKQLIEFLNQEGRNFGWSYPENQEEDKCETEFWKLNEAIKSIIKKMNVNERLHSFDYWEDYNNLKPIEKSAREAIELKLFIK